MSALRNLVDKIKPTFTKGGKLGFLESTFDAFETFLFVPNTTTQKGAHIRDCNDMKRTMIMVVVALMPALLFGFYNTGYLHFLSQGVQPEFWASLWFGFLKVLPIIVVSYVVGLGIEFAFAQARGHEVNEGFLVTGLLIPMIMPVDIPLWMVALATAFSVIFGKEVFGGTGMNVFNPALLARAFAFFAYTPSMSGATVWIAGMTEDMKNVAANIPGYVPQVVDGFSGATALENLSTTGQMGYSAMDAFLGFIPGCIGETSTLAILLGAAILLFTGVASWRTMVSVELPTTADYGYYCNGKMYKKGSVVTLEENMTFTSVNKLDLTITNGVSIRLVTGETGLRYKATITSDNNEAINSDAIKEGILITTQANYNDTDSNIKIGSDNVLNVANVSETNNKWYAEKNDTINNKYGGTFCGSIIKMIDSNIPRPFVARAYATIKYEGYSDATVIYTGVIGKKSIKDIAKLIQKGTRYKTENGYSVDEIKIIDDFANYADAQ